MFYYCAFHNVWAIENENDEGFGGVKGKITTSDNKPASMVTVVVKGTKKNALAAADGYFIIRNIKPGDYELEFSLIGYENISRHITIEANKTEYLSIQLQISNKQMQD